MTTGRASMQPLSCQLAALPEAFAGLVLVCIVQGLLEQGPQTGHALLEWGVLTSQM